MVRDLILEVSITTDTCAFKSGFISGSFLKVHVLVKAVYGFI